MNGVVPPMLRRRDALEYLGGNVSVTELQEFEACGAISTFQKRPKSKKWYRRDELKKIRDGESQ